MPRLRPFSEQGAFRSINESSLQRAVVRGAGSTISAAAFSLFVQLGGTIVLARLLTPADFGIVAMVTTFSWLLSNFGAAGLTEAIIQRPDMNHALASNLFWVNVAARLLLAAGFASLGPAIARFYHNPQVAGVTVWMAIAMAIAGFEVVHLALLKRAMYFEWDAAIGFAGRLAMTIAAIATALTGWGYWALVAGYVAQSATTLACAWWACHWRPGIPGSVAGTFGSLKFGMSIYGRYCLNYCMNNTDNLLVGWRFNAEVLGFYKKAYDLFVLPSSQLTAPIWHVAVSALSRVNENRERLSRYILQGIGALAFIGMGIGADLTLVGGDLVRLIMGPAWEETGRIFVLFGPGIGVMLLYSAQAWIHVSIGRPDRWLRWGLVEFAITTCMFVVAIQWGSRAIAAAWTVSYFFLTIPAFWYAGRPIAFRVRPVIEAVWRYFVASVAAGEGAYWTLHKVLMPNEAQSGLGALVRLISTSVVFAIFYGGTTIAFHRGLAPFRQIAGLLRGFLSGRKRDQADPGIEPEFSLGDAGR